MSDRRQYVLLADLYGELEGDGVMEFWLTYRGPLKATQRDPMPGSAVKAAHWKLKHDMRKQFHTQIKGVWESHPLLKAKQSHATSALNAENLASQYKLPPWSFVPLVTLDLEVLCGLEIVLLRQDHPGSSIWSGDIDNRVKTLIDALEVPDANSGYADIASDDSINPLYCLLGNDKLLTSVSVETGRLLNYSGTDQSWAEVTVRVRVNGMAPYMP